MPTLDGSEGTYITQTQAQTLGQNYMNSSRYQATGYIKAHYLGKDKLSELLGQDGCMGLRIYYGTKIETSGLSVPDLVVVGTDANGNDILEDDLILDVSLPCPPLCPESGKGVMD